MLYIEKVFGRNEALYQSFQTAERVYNYIDRVNHLNTSVPSSSSSSMSSSSNKSDGGKGGDGGASVSLGNSDNDDDNLSVVSTATEVHAAPVYVRALPPLYWNGYLHSCEVFHPILMDKATVIMRMLEDTINSVYFKEVFQDLLKNGYMETRSSKRVSTFHFSYEDKSALDSLENPALSSFSSPIPPPTRLYIHPQYLVDKSIDNSTNSSVGGGNKITLSKLKFTISRPRRPLSTKQFFKYIKDISNEDMKLFKEQWYVYLQHSISFSTLSPSLSLPSRSTKVQLSLVHV